jgi:DNA-binding NarL/FixJ family response regulator
MRVRVLVVDDQEPFRLAAAAVVEATPGFEVVGEAASGEDALRAVAALQPDLVLMDVVLPGLDGLAATRRVKDAAPDVVVLLLSTYDLQDHGRAVASSGAAAFVPKSRFGTEVLLDLLPSAPEVEPASDGERLPHVAPEL